MSVMCFVAKILKRQAEVVRDVPRVAVAALLSAGVPVSGAEAWNGPANGFRRGSMCVNVIFWAVRASTLLFFRGLMKHWRNTSAKMVTDSQRETS